MCDANLYSRLGAYKTPEDSFFVSFGEGDIGIDPFHDLGAQAGKILLLGNYRKAGHFGGTGTNGEIVLVALEIAAWTGLAPKNHDSPVFAL